MINTLEEILINSILEQTENDSQLSIKSVQLTFSLLMKNKDVFEKVPFEIYTPISTYENNRISNITQESIKEELKSREDNINFFKSKGVLLYDGIYGSAFGRMNYIYRSKGIRIYLFEDGYIRVFSTYCTIDDNGFSLANEEIDSIEINKIDSKGSIESIFQYFPNYSSDTFFNYSIALIKILINIKKTFHKDYIIEYLLTPPDVDFISDFSLDVKIGLWDIFTDKSFVKEIPIETQKIVMSTLTSLGITPTTEQLLKYLELQEHENTNQEILDKLEILQESVIDLKHKKEDIFEFKPNFYGVGMNGNEMLRRILSKKNK